jgi:hypothetical protein
VIFHSDAVIDPLAMMVEPLHTFVADIAVSRLTGANHLASGAKHIRIEFLHQLQKTHFV